MSGVWVGCGWGVGGVWALVGCECVWEACGCECGWLGACACAHVHVKYREQAMRYWLLAIARRLGSDLGSDCAQEDKR